MEKIINQIKTREPTGWKDVIVEQVVYKTSDGSIFEREIDAINKEKSIEREKLDKEFMSKIEIVDLDEEGGKYYYVHSKEDLLRVFKIESLPWNSEVNKINKYPCWVWLKFEDGGDYGDWTGVMREPDIIENAKMMKAEIEKILSKV